MTKPPPKHIQAAIRSHIDEWSRQVTHGVIRRLIRPLPLYCYEAKAGTGEDARIRFVPMGWRTFFRTKGKATCVLDTIIGTEGYSYRFYVGEAPARWLERTVRLQRRSAVVASDVRILTLPAIHMSYFWFRTAGPDLFAPLDPSQAPPSAKEGWLSKRDLISLVRGTLRASAAMWRQVPTIRKAAQTSRAQTTKS